jgi:hypothetical protein
MPRKWEQPNVDREELDRHAKRLAYNLNVLTGIFLALLVIFFVIDMVRDFFGIK